MNHKCVVYGDEILPDGSEFTNTCKHFVATAPIPCHLRIPQVDSDYHINIRVSNFVHFLARFGSLLLFWRSVIIVNRVYVRNFSRKRIFHVNLNICQMNSWAWDRGLVYKLSEDDHVPLHPHLSLQIRLNVCQKNQ